MNSARPRIGILGAGQLALMLAEASAHLDVEILCAGRHGDCAERAAPVIPVDLHDAAAVAAFAAQVDLVTIESENIDADVLRGLNLYPNVNAVATAQDRLLEKRFFLDCGLEVAPFASISSLNDLRAAIADIGCPAILKTRRMGYDGKGQVRLRSPHDAEYAWSTLRGIPCILEGMVDFDAEVSLIAARSRSGEIAFYPLTENTHREGILRVSRAPAFPELQSKAEVYLTHLLEKLDYIGVLAVEFFVRDRHLLANEMAPRVHNSGHWTIEGSETSQFENCLRATLGLPLGSTASQPTVMLNCIGSMPPEPETRRYPELARHDYGKAPRPSRKVGHLTFPAAAAQAIVEWQYKLDSNE